MPVANQTRMTQIADVLCREILTGQYRAGERLPSERDLAARFAVTRGVVREALKKLEQLGVASIQPGGPRVVPIEDATLEILGYLLDLGEAPDPGLISQIFDVLAALISLSARTAVLKADAGELEKARTILAGIIEAGSVDARQGGWHELANHFHRINQNLVLRLIGNGLKTQFLGRFEALNWQAGVIDVSADRLQELDDAIAARDPEAAASATAGHFQLVKERILKSLEDMAATETPSSHVTPLTGPADRGPADRGPADRGPAKAGQRGHTV